MLAWISAAESPCPFRLDERHAGATGLAAVVDQDLGEQRAADHHDRSDSEDPQHTVSGRHGG